MVGVSLKTIVRVVVEGCFLCSTKVTNGNSLITRNIKFASKVHLGVRANIRVAKGTAISLLSGGQSG